MFKNNPNSENGVTIPESAWNVIQKQTESLAARDSRLTSLSAC